MLNWVKTHLVLLLIIVILLFIIFYLIYSSDKNRVITSTSSVMPSSSVYKYSGSSDSVSTAQGVASIVPSIGITYPEKVSDNSNRLVIQESYMSLLVSDVSKTSQQILDYTKTVGGFMVSSSYSRPDESSSSTITVRIPSDKKDQVLSYFRSQAMKVTDENLLGSDITAQYEDTDARINTLNKTKAKFESILEKATAIQDILNINQQIISVQQQIDSLVGQKQAMEKNAQYMKITLYISTDELSLPYTPDKAFRPSVIFKQAVRSMLGTLRVAGEVLIWVGVYAVIWLPLLVIFLLLRRWVRRGNSLSSLFSKKISNKY